MYKFSYLKKKCCFCQNAYLFRHSKENSFTIKTKKKVSQSDENWLKFFAIRAEEKRDPAKTSFRQID